ncbi:MAG: helix-turn-helix transcriptional regulator [Cytophagales bacterium]
MKNNLTTEYNVVLIKFGEKVRYYRKLRRMTQLDLSIAVEIDSRHIQRIEKGRINTSIMVAFSISRILGVAMDELFSFDINEEA